MARSTSKAKKSKAVETYQEHADISRENILPGELSESQQSSNGTSTNPYVLSDSANGSDLESELHRRIAERAFLLYEERGFRHGNDLDHWLEAERQVKTRGV
jgi:Protein of unknown function (DUF2934)